mgnify:CR=1 FL=1
MPMVPEAAVAMLACTRIGAIHSVVFGGFSAESIKDRVLDSGAVAIVCMSRFYGTVQQVLPKTQIKTVIVTNIKDYMSPLLAFLFGLTKEKK